MASDHKTSTSGKPRAWYREPLVHFLGLGLLLFGLYALVNPQEGVDTDRRIVVTESDVDWLRTTFASQWNRQPTDAELEALIDGHIREEVYYREALALGLESDDTIIRRRLVQKMEFLSEDLALAADPTADALRSFFEDHPDLYRVPPRLTFTHIYFSPDQRGPRTPEDVREALARLGNGPVSAAVLDTMGDRFLLDYEYGGLLPADIDRLFGEGFGQSLLELDTGGWQGPVESAFGLHLVRIDERADSVLPSFDEVPEQVRRDFDADRRLQMNTDFYAALRDRYAIEVDTGTSAETRTPQAAAAEGRE